MKSIIEFNTGLRNAAEVNWSLLGLVRFILAMIVVAGHMRFYIPEGKVLAFQNLSGFAAVLGFLYLSGYSIAHSYFAQPKGYYFRRFLRIVPLYWISIFFAILVVVFFQGAAYNLVGHSFENANLLAAFGNMFFLQGTFFHPWPVNIVVWTISIEVFFYLISPLLYNIKSSAILIVILLSAFLFIIWRYFGSEKIWQLKFGLPMALLAWSWLSGFWIYKMATSCSSILVSLSIAIVSLSFHNVYLPYMWPITIIIPLLSLAFSSQIKFNKPISGLFKWLGDISYPIYLFHLPIFSLIYVLNPNQKWFLYIFIMFVVTTFVDRYIDRPLKRALKNAYQKYRSRI